MTTSTTRAHGMGSIKGANVDPTQPHRPGEGEATQPEGPVNWHDMESDTYEPTWGALCDFLAWAVPRWGFTTEQFPHRCWWQHPDIVEEFTAWWGLWQAHVRNPAASISAPMTFQEQTYQLKLRLEYTYRGRCRKGHEPDRVLTVAVPDDH